MFISIKFDSGDCMNPGFNFATDPFLSDFDEQTIHNFCSWLLNFKAYELPILSYAIAVVLSESFTIQERTVIGSIFSTIATNTFLIAAQQGFLLQVESAKTQQQVKYNNEDRESLVKRIKYIEKILKVNNLM